MKTAKLTTALAVCLALLAIVGAGNAFAAFGFRGLENVYQDPAGAPVTQAGFHTDLKTTVKFNLTELAGGGEVTPDESIRDVITDLPAGFYGNPQSLPFCTLEQLQVGEGYCNPDAQVGVFTLHVGVTDESFGLEFPIYNMASSDNQTAVLGTIVISVPVKLIVSVRTDGDYGLQVRAPNINASVALGSLPVELWGVPQAGSHSPKRCKGLFNCGYASSVPETPFLTMPTRCGAPVFTDVSMRSWEHPETWVRQRVANDPLTGCDNLDFAPTLKARPTTTAADSPSGLDVDLNIPQSVDPEGLGTAQLRKAEAILPEGLVINPSGANGLDACAPSQIHLTSANGVVPPTFSKAEPECPDASRIGTVQVDTPLLADPLLGSVYVAKPYDNPFNSLLAVYAAFKGPGLNVKIPGEIKPDPKTGRLTAVFSENPQLTFEDFRMKFFGGAFAPLRTPATCGSYSTTGTMTAWSAPETPTVPTVDNYSITQAPGGKKGCATSAGALPNSPSFEGGSTAAIAGQYKPFVVNLRRDDGSQEFSEVTLKPPPGLVAKLANTQICSDAALATAAGKSGAAEMASSSCPAASEVGSVFAAAGAGPAPFWASGKVYLSGPYKGAPLSLAIVTPAVAGPYDLGTIVVKTALYLDPKTAEVTAKSDPIPAILKGVPLDVRQVSIRLDKPDFTLNPTSCDPTEVTGSLLSTAGNSANLNNRFQLAECGRLHFKPRLALSLKGGIKRGEYPALKAVLKPRKGDANIASVQVALPHSEFLAQNHIRTVCTRVQWAADNCPRGSIYGKVKVETPILGYPLTGNVYLRSSSNPLPDLVPDLRGPAFQPIRFEAAGKTDSIKGGIRNTFSFVPDVPFTKLTLQLQGGKKGLLQNSRNICAAINKADVNYTAHNGLTFSERPALTTKCKKSKKGKNGKSKKGKRGGKR
jgi:hypothetical protein